MMKKVLILAYEFPPYVSVAGLRPNAWYKYMKEFDVYPIIITRQWNNKHGTELDYVEPSESSTTIYEKSEYGEIIRVSFKPTFSNRLLLKYGENRFKYARKLITAAHEFMQYFVFSGSKSNIFHEADKYLASQKVDMIIATGDPYVLFKYASELASKYDIPWIADYRDPWSNDMNIENNTLVRMFSKYQEQKTIPNAYWITTVSEFVKMKISGVIPDKNISIFPNGYDPEVTKTTINIETNKQMFSIGYAGSIFKWHPIRSFLGVLADYVKNNPTAKIMVNFYGVNIPDKLAKMIEREFAVIKPYVKIHAKINHDIFLKELATNHVMLLFNYYSDMGTKVYDYLGIKRKILMCYESDVEALQLKEKYYTSDEPKSLSNQLQQDLIKSTNGGIVA